MLLTVAQLFTKRCWPDSAWEDTEYPASRTTNELHLVDLHIGYIFIKTNDIMNTEIDRTEK